MRYFYTPSKDASIYQQFPTFNTGLDEILEVGTSDHGTQAVRSLVQFDLTNISASLSTGEIPANAKFDLVLYLANASSLKVAQNVQGKIITNAWTEGSGYFNQDTLNAQDGASWKNAQSGSLWTASGSATSSAGAIVQPSGNPIGDFTFDLTAMVSGWVSGTVANDGILFKFPDADEQDPTNMGNIKFFSRDTHTIYRPTLVAKWDDQVWNTGSLQAAPSHSLLAVPGNMKPAYRVGEVARVDIYVREQYPLKTANNIFTSYQGNRALPQTSYFSIIDEQSGNIVIPFDDYSKLSVDPVGSFMKFTVQNMFPLRYYRVLLKVVHDGLDEIFDNNVLFTVRQ